MCYCVLKLEVIKVCGNWKEVISNIKIEIEVCLEELGIDVIIFGWEKYLYSIYKKMLNKELLFNEVMDIYVFWINVDNMDICYCVLGVVYNFYKLIEICFKDYIVVFKINGY